jgi:hypothetical protein
MKLVHKKAVAAEAIALAAVVAILAAGPAEMDAVTSYAEGCFAALA